MDKERLAACSPFLFYPFQTTPPSPSSLFLSFSFFFFFFFLSFFLLFTYLFLFIHFTSCSLPPPRSPPAIVPPIPPSLLSRWGLSLYPPPGYIKSLPGYMHPFPLMQTWQPTQGSICHVQAIAFGIALSPYGDQAAHLLHMLGEALISLCVQVLS